MKKKRRPYRRQPQPRRNLMVGCSPESYGRGVLGDLLGDGRTVMSLNLHRIIDRLVEDMTRNGDPPDPKEVEHIRARTPAIMMMTPLKNS